MESSNLQVPCKTCDVLNRIPQGATTFTCTFCGTYQRVAIAIQPVGTVPNDTVTPVDTDPKVLEPKVADTTFLENLDENPSFQTVEEFIAYQDRLRTLNEGILESMNKDDDEIKALEAKLKAAKAKKSPKEAKRFEIHKAIQASQREMEALKRKLALEAEQRRIMAMMAARRKSLDELTANALWREFALPHQIEGAHYLSAAGRAICADGMGTGKTLQAVMTLDFWRAKLEGGRRVLIICPSEVTTNFKQEFNKWAPKRPVIDISNKGTANTVAGIEMFVERMTEFTLLINYEILARSFNDKRTRKQLLRALIAAKFDTVICDEAHRMKESEKPTYKAIRELVLTHNMCPICEAPTVPTHKDGTAWIADRWHRETKCEDHGIVENTNRSVRNFLAMTGTPILNRPDEIFAPLSLANPTAFPRHDSFAYDFCRRSEYTNKLVWKFGGESRLVNKIQGMYIRRTREDAGIILPPQDTTVHELILDPDTYPLQTKIMERLAKHAQIEIDEGRVTTMVSMLALITRQRQAAVWPGGIYLTHTDPVTGEKTREHIGVNYQESIKLDKACELAQEFTDNGERTVIFSNFAEPITTMVDRLNAMGIRAIAFYGATSKDENDPNGRNAIKRNFDRVQMRNSGEEVKWDVVVAHYKLASEGLNLTACTQTIVLDEQWNPGMNQQAYDRTNRMGQTEETGVHILRIKNSIDSWMAALINEKRKIVDGFETEITFAQLAALFKKDPNEGLDKD